MQKHLRLRRHAQLMVGAVVITCCSFSGASGVTAQGLDDLFARPVDAQYEIFGEDASDVEAERAGYRSRPATIPASSRSGASSRAVSGDRAVQSPSDLRLEHSSGSRIESRALTAMEIRQARALEETRARIARLEAARWGLRPTLRPSWVSDPMTSSRYPNAHSYIVPIYVLVP
ncbi:malate synthase [Aporhodopirellula aestuarii]|uniref:Malate synthase n=1 Tax=Aporhodopirellula aestuarii TaxID=2950107 RepID=A0ABT0UDM9_9BACT|nr:malate synthase [Aporhodopirellula aestuarii]MCM2375162.1 malate synthase [Aporhodopirellula aestuarii]